LIFSAAALQHASLVSYCSVNWRAVTLSITVQIALCPASTTIVALYMCNEPVAASPSRATQPRPHAPSLAGWPGGARVQASFGSWRGDGDGVEWGNETRTVVDEVLLHSLSNMQRYKESQKGKKQSRREHDDHHRHEMSFDVEL
jgi:hypothetical protein